MQKEIRKFLRDQTRAVLVLDYAAPGNVAYEGAAIQNPLRSVFNLFVIKLCKYVPLRIKNFLLRSLLRMKIGKNVGIALEVDFDELFPELVTLEDNVIIGLKTYILCHEFTQKKIRLGRVHVKQNALIGAFSVVRSGVTIGENSMVAMCSFVNKDIPDNELWGGVPARKIKKLVP